MLARDMGIDGFWIAINLPQREDVWVFATPTDIELDHARLPARRVAQLPKQRFGTLRILGSEGKVNGIDQHGTHPKKLTTAETLLQGYCTTVSVDTRDYACSSGTSPSSRCSCTRSRYF